ncbi:MAG: ComEC/Rec2 family competence protein [Acidimicrobiia bacterium]
MAATRGGGVDRATHARAHEPVVALLAVTAGIVTGERVGAGPATAMVAAAPALIAVALRARSVVRPLALFLAFGAIGVACTQRALDGLDHSPLAALVARRADVTMWGTLTDDPSGTYGARALVRVDRVATRSAVVGGGGRTVVLVAAGRAAGELRVLEAGDRVEVRGALSPLRAREADLRWRHAVARCSLDALVSFDGPRAGILRVAAALRRWVLRGNAHLPARERGLLAAFLLGDTREMPRALVDDFRAAGLSHLLVVSGANVAFVLALVAPVLRRSPLVVRFLGAGVVLGLFGAMTRWEPSVLRAIVMAALASAGALLGRPQRGVRLVVVAVTALLLADPFLLHSVGFRLSVGATLGIALFAPWCSERLRGPRWFRDALGVTIAAQLGVAPVLIPVFGSMPLVTLPANLVAVPVAGPLTVLGLVSGLVSVLLGGSAPAVAATLRLPVVLLARFVETVARVAAQVPVAVDGPMAWRFMAGGCILAAAGRMRRLRGQGGRA